MRYRLNPYSGRNNKQNAHYYSNIIFENLLDGYTSELYGVNDFTEFGKSAMAEALHQIIESSELIDFFKILQKGETVPEDGFELDDNAKYNSEILIVNHFKLVNVQKLDTMYSFINNGGSVVLIGYGINYSSLPYGRKPDDIYACTTHLFIPSFVSWTGEPLLP